jgi:hypothetical protein
MALKVVPAGDERCDIHTQRKPARYVCESCLKEFGIQADRPRARPRRRVRVRARRAMRGLRRRRWSADRKLLIGAGAGLLVAGLIAVALTTAGGDGDSESPSGPPREADVVNALELVPDPSGTGWTTLDGACWVVSIQIGDDVRAGRIAGGQLFEATNDELTVGAAVTQGDFSVSQAECVARIGSALRTQF